MIYNFQNVVWTSGCTILHSQPWLNWWISSVYSKESHPVKNYILVSLSLSLLTLSLCLSPPESVVITPKDARWVGAWWLGFLVSSAFLLLSSVPFWFLPRSLPKHEGEQNRQENVSGTTEAIGSNHSLKLTDIAKGFLKLPCNFGACLCNFVTSYIHPILFRTLFYCTNCLCSINEFHFSECDLQCWKSFFVM